jgi:hypothetical protein
MFVVYFSNENTCFDGSYVLTLIKLNRVFVKSAAAYDSFKNKADGILSVLPPYITQFSLFDASIIDQIIVATLADFGDTLVQTTYIIISTTQTTTPT